MIELVRLSDQVALQLLCDALQQRSIPFRADHAGMNALMPLPGVMEARIYIEEDDLKAAQMVLADLEME